MSDRFGQFESTCDGMFGCPTCGNALLCPYSFSLSNLCFISMPCSKYDGNCFQKSKHLVKRVDLEMDGK